MMRMLLVLVPVLALGLGSASKASSIYIEPADLSAPLGAGMVSVELFMDFTGSPTVGGGIDLSLSGPISLGAFMPSAFFSNETDPAFTGFGKTQADQDLEIHFGNFAGLSGVNKLGDLALDLLEPGIGTITIAINSTFGAFYGIDSQQQEVALEGARIQVLPEPAVACWLITAIGLLSIRRLGR